MTARVVTSILCVLTHRRYVPFTCIFSFNPHNMRCILLSYHGRGQNWPLESLNDCSSIRNSGAVLQTLVLNLETVLLTSPIFCHLPSVPIIHCQSSCSFLPFLCLKLFQVTGPSLPQEVKLFSRLGFFNTCLDLLSLNSNCIKLEQERKGAYL